MITPAKKPILFFDDAIGIGTGYSRLFNELSRGQATAVSLYHKFNKSELLMWKGNRKAPGYKLDTRSLTKLHTAVIAIIQLHKPQVIVTADPATLGLLMLRREESWDWATMDNCRGGVYHYFGLPWIVTYPFTAYHSEVRERDIAVANSGFSDETEFDQYANRMFESGTGQDSNDESDTSDAADADAEDDERHFYAPVLTKINVGQFCITSDWAKAFRILAAIRNQQP